MIQIRGGRGYETAESLAARGEKPVPAEQLLRDMRINRIFEGSTEIMHLLIAREAVDQHLQAAGDVLDPQTPVGRQGSATPSRRAGSTPSWFPTLAVGEGQQAGRLRRVRRARAARPLRRARARASSPARPSTSWAATRRGLEHKGHLLGRIVDLGAELYAIACACVYAQTIAREHPERGEGAAELADLFCPAGPPPRRRAVPRAVGQRRRRPAHGRAGRSSPAATRGSRRTCSTRRATARCSPSTRPRPPSATPRPRPRRRGAGRDGAVAAAAGAAPADLP